jgi:hypothetical protein
MRQTVPLIYVARFLSTSTDFFTLRTHPLTLRIMLAFIPRHYTSLSLMVLFMGKLKALS